MRGEYMGSVIGFFFGFFVGGVFGMVILALLVASRDDVDKHK